MCTPLFSECLPLCYNCGTPCPECSQELGLGLPSELQTAQALKDYDQIHPEHIQNQGTCSEEICENEEAGIEMEENVQDATNDRLRERELSSSYCARVASFVWVSLPVCFHCTLAVKCTQYVAY